MAKVKYTRDQEFVLRLAPVDDFQREVSRQLNAISLLFGAIASLSEDTIVSGLCNRGAEFSERIDQLISANRS